MQPACFIEGVDHGLRQAASVGEGCRLGNKMHMAWLGLPNLSEYGDGTILGPLTSTAKLPASAPAILALRGGSSASC